MNQNRGLNDFKGQGKAVGIAGIRAAGKEMIAQLCQSAPDAFAPRVHPDKFGLTGRDVALGVGGGKTGVVCLQLL